MSKTFCSIIKPRSDKEKMKLKPTATNKQAVLDAAKSYFRHPSRCNWMDESVKQWARQNKDKV